MEFEDDAELDNTDDDICILTSTDEDASEPEGIL